MRLANVTAAKTKSRYTNKKYRTANEDRRVNTYITYATSSVAVARQITTKCTSIMHIYIHSYLRSRQHTRGTENGIQCVKKPVQLFGNIGLSKQF